MMVEKYVRYAGRSILFLIGEKASRSIVLANAQI